MNFKEIEEILDGQGIKYDIRPDEGYALVEFWTDTAGQDIPAEIEFDGTPEGFVKEFTQRAENYDVDEEVELYAGIRGKDGVPNTIRELINDCQEAKDTLMSIARSLKGEQKPEDIDEGLKELFPDWQSIQKGEWSIYGRIIQTAGPDKVEIGLYREPDGDDEIAGTLTLQIFVNDDVVVCKQVSTKEVA